MIAANWSRKSLTYGDHKSFFFFFHRGPIFNTDRSRAFFIPIRKHWYAVQVKISWYSLIHRLRCVYQTSNYRPHEHNTENAVPEVFVPKITPTALKKRHARTSPKPTEEPQSGVQNLLCMDSYLPRDFENKGSTAHNSRATQYTQRCGRCRLSV